MTVPLSWIINSSALFLGWRLKYITASVYWGVSTCLNQEKTSVVSIVCFIEFTADCFKERASMIFDTHTVFLIHVWTWWGDEDTPSYLKAGHSGDGETEHGEKKRCSSARVILQRWTTNKHVLCLAALITMWITSIMCRQCFYGPKKSLNFHFNWGMRSKEHRLSLSTSNIKCHRDQTYQQVNQFSVLFNNRPNGPSGALSKNGLGTSTVL